jgi:type IV secretory pathway component VirB8
MESKFIYDSIAKHERSGQYYKDARNWYFSKYVYAPWERAILLWIAVLAVCSAGIIGFGFYSLFPLVRELNIAITIPNDNTYPVLRTSPANNNNYDAEQAALDFLIRRYVIQRESYSYDNLGKQKLQIKNLSSNIVFKKFSNYISVSNPNSPVLLYQKNMIRSVVIQSIAFDLNEDIVLVKFKTKVHDYITNSEEESSWISRMSYTISDINSVIYDKSKFEFKVTDYIVQPLR